MLPVNFRIWQRQLSEATVKSGRHRASSPHSEWTTEDFRPT